MGSTIAALSKTQLHNRTLWFDGDSTVSSKEISKLLSVGMPPTGLFVDQITEDIRKYNQFVQPTEQITVKKNLTRLAFDWNIPEEYKNLDVVGYLLDCLEDQSDDLTDEQVETRTTRIAREMALYRSLNLEDVLRTLIYIINILQHHNIVWGIGRGSSVSSYVLFLIGVHDVDSVKYDLDINDFLRKE